MVRIARLVPGLFYGILFLAFKDQVAVRILFYNTKVGIDELDLG
jgi:hypothetical protein